MHGQQTKNAQPCNRCVRDAPSRFLDCAAEQPNDAGRNLEPLQTMQRVAPCSFLIRTGGEQYRQQGRTLRSSFCRVVWRNEARQTGKQRQSSPCPRGETPERPSPRTERIAKTPTDVRGRLDMGIGGSLVPATTGSDRRQRVACPWRSRTERCITCDCRVGAAASAGSAATCDGGTVGFGHQRSLSAAGVAAWANGLVRFCDTLHLAARRRFAAAPVPAPAPGTNGSGTCQCRRARMDLLPEFVRGAACHSRTELGWWWWCLNGPRDGHRQQLSTPYTRSRAQGWPSTNRVIWIFGHQQPYRVASAASLPQELIGHPPNRPVAVPAVPSADAGSRRNNATPTRGGPPPLRPSQDRCSTVLHGPARSSDAPCQQRRRAIRRALTAMRCDASRVETRPGGSARA